jgi:1-acyl-sn-glycerol-3-phosphate acyltransferase
VIIVAVLRVLFVVLHTVFWGVPIIVTSFFDPHAERAARLIRFWAKGNLWACGVTVRPRGHERLDPHKAYIFMANHQSQFDILAVTTVLRDFQLRWVAKQELRKIPVLGQCMQVTHQVLVDREDRTRAIAVMRKIKTLLGAGISVLFFPEGTRSKDGRLLPFKPGGFATAVETKVSVVPVTINGSRTILPAGEWRIRPGDIEIIFGEPIAIDTKTDKKTARNTLLHEVRTAIAAHHYDGDSGHDNTDAVPRDGATPSSESSHLTSTDARAASTPPSERQAPSAL